MPMSTTNHFIFHKIPLIRTHSKYTPSLMRLQNPGRIQPLSLCHPIAPGVTHQYDNIALYICRLPNRLLAPFIFLAIMWVMFQLTFTIGAPFQDAIDQLFGYIAESVAGAIPNEYLASFICDGIIGGVGGVLTFLPINFHLLAK